MFRFYEDFLSHDGRSVTIDLQMAILNKEKNLLQDESNIKDVQVSNTDDGSLSIGLGLELSKIFDS
jgi:hypothetical protein